VPVAMQQVPGEISQSLIDGLRKTVAEMPAKKAYGHR